MCITFSIFLYFHRLGALVFSPSFPTEKKAKIDVEYEWVPSTCSKCKCFGHIDYQCPTKKMWRPKELVSAVAPSTSTISDPIYSVDGEANALGPGQCIGVLLDQVPEPAVSVAQHYVVSASSSGSTSCSKRQCLQSHVPDHISYNDISISDQGLAHPAVVTDILQNQCEMVHVTERLVHVQAMQLQCDTKNMYQKFQPLCMLSSIM